jgi:hypothetical protein
MVVPIQEELGYFEKEELNSWQTVTHKKLSCVEEVKNTLTGANTKPIQAKMPWRPRITIFDWLGQKRNMN